jgi:PAS domain-containing protein
MSMDETLIGLIDEIYALIRDPSGLQQLVGRIADWRGADMALLTAPALPGCKPVPLMAYKMDFTPVMGRPDLLMQPEFTRRAVATGRAPGVFTLDELMPAQERDTSEYWQSIIAPLGIGSGMLAIIRTADDNMRPVSLNLFRRASSTPFDAADIEAMAAPASHMRRALSLLLDGPSGLTSFEQDMDFAALNTPVFSLNQSAKVVRCNEAAERLLESDDGVALHEDRLTLRDGDRQRELDAALGRVIGDDWSTKMRNGAEVSAPRPSGLPALSLVAVPTGAENPIATAAASVRCLVFVYGSMSAPARAAGRKGAAALLN